MCAMLFYSERVMLDNSSVSHRELLLAMQLLLSMGIAGYNSGLPIILDDLHELEADLVQIQAETVVL